LDGYGKDERTGDKNEKREKNPKRDLFQHETGRGGGPKFATITSEFKAVQYTPPKVTGRCEKAKDWGEKNRPKWGLKIGIGEKGKGRVNPLRNGIEGEWGKK